jgi:predicted transcriptional regulator
MRWAGSVSDKPYGKVTSADLARFLNDPGNKIDQRAVDELTRQTFPEVHQS